MDKQSFSTIESKAKDKKRWQKEVSYEKDESMKKTAGIVLIYTAAILIMFSILFLFDIIRVDYAYTTAALGFLVYIVGLFLTREGKFTPYKIGMIVISMVLILFALMREVL